jgi:1-acyl-sn-glycerol-3-phosphate acyltransferase
MAGCAILRRPRSRGFNDTMQPIFTFLVLVAVWTFSRVFYRLRERWVGAIPPRDWTDLRVIAILHHTSLMEIVLAGYAEWSLLWQFANHGVLPVAEKTIRRKIGVFFRFLVRHVVVVTRQRDHTWDEMLNRVDDQSIAIILPEGRMMRANGLDSSGRPMTVRGGIADILENLHSGRMLLIYNQGLHHIQVPGEGLPRLFKPVDVIFELVDIDQYKEQVMTDHDALAFRKAVVADLSERRDRYCPPPPFTES